MYRVSQSHYNRTMNDMYEVWLLDGLKPVKRVSVEDTLSDALEVLRAMWTDSESGTIFEPYTRPEYLEELLTDDEE